MMVIAAKKAEVIRCDGYARWDGDNQQQRPENGAVAEIIADNYQHLGFAAMMEILLCHQFQHSQPFVMVGSAAKLW